MYALIGSDGSSKLIMYEGFEALGDFLMTVRIRMMLYWGYSVIIVKVLES